MAIKPISKPKMQDEWKEILSLNSQARAYLVKSLLEEHDIKVILLNQKDSSYLAFGEIKVHVLAKDVIVAKKLIENLKD